MKQVLLGLFIGLILGLGLGSMWFSSSPPAESGLTGLVQARTFEQQGEPGAAVKETLSAPAPAPTRAIQVGHASAPAADISLEQTANALAHASSVVGSRPSGDGVIRGSVKDQDGLGVSAVRVRAVAHDKVSYLRQASSVAKAPQEHSIEASLQSAAEKYARRELRMFEAQTDRNGSFVLENLAPLVHDLQLECDGYLIWPEVQGYRGSIARPGDTVQYLARRVIDVPISVRHQDGTTAVGAIIRCSNLPITDDDEWSQHIFGRGASEFAWSPGEPTLRLPVGTVHLRAYAAQATDAVPQMIGSADERSESRELVVTSAGFPAPVILEVIPSPGIRGTLTLLGTYRSTTSPRISIAHLEPNEEVDLDRLKHSELSVYMNVDPEFSFMDIPTGRYLVGASRDWSSVFSAHKVVEVSNGVTRCDLELPPIEEERFLRIMILDENGKPTSGLRFNFTHRQGGSSSGLGSGDPSRDAEGAFLYQLPESAQAAYYETPTASDSFTLRLSKSGYGEVQVALTPGQEEITVQLEAEARLLVSCQGLAGSGFQNKLRATLSPSAAQEGSELDLSAEVSKSLGSDGAVRFAGLAPGTYELTLKTRWVRIDENSWDGSQDILKRSVVLESGANEVTLTWPVLYPLDVTVTGVEEGRQVNLLRQTASGDNNSPQASRTTDASGHVEFATVSPGEYLLHIAGDKRYPISVPCGALTFASED